MALLDEARSQKQRKGERCSVATFLSRLSPDELAEVDEALTAHDVPVTAVVRAMEARWENVPHFRNWQRHYLRHECSCDG